MKGKKVDLPKIQASLCNSLYNVDKCVDLLGVLCLFERYSKDKHQVQKYGEANIFDIVAPYQIKQ